MANKILNIGEQTVNLLSNDNFIVYSDISMRSKFNSASTTTTTEPLPVEEDYFAYLIPEVNSILSDGTYLSDLTGTTVLSVLSNSINALSDYTIENELSIAIHSTEQYMLNYKQYVNKMSLSKYRVEKNINVKAVQDSLHNIFSWMPGERILNPEFGSTLYRQLYNGITDYNTEQIMAEIRKNISEWEPRVQLEQVKNISDINDTENNTIHLEIVYSIPSLNNKQYNYTYVYHKQSI